MTEASGAWQQLQRLFHTALEREPQRREEFVVKSCEDPHMRDEVLRLVQLAGANDLLSPPIDGILTTFPDATDPLDTFLSWLQIEPVGAYQLHRQIAAGPVSDVFEARTLDRPGDRFALKLLRRTRATPSITRRFRRECDALASLDHPSIAHFVDAGVSDRGRLFLVTEFVEGRPLDEYCRVHELDLMATLELVSTISDAVHYAHRNLIVHLDLKPSNILVTPNGTPVLLDFGAMRSLDGSSRQTTDTSGGFTLPYASPEQVRGARATTTSDIYTMGVILHELVTGYPPHSAARHAPFELAQAICTAEPPRASRSAGTAGPIRGQELVGNLDNIITTAMHKDPERRYASAAEFAEELRRHQRGAPVRARPDGTGRRLVRFLARHRLVTALVMVLFGCLVAGVVGTSWGLLQARAGWSRAVEAEAETEAVLEFMHNALASPLHHVSRRTVPLHELLDDAVGKLDRGAVHSRSVEARVRVQIGSIYRSLSLQVEAAQQCRRAIAICSEMSLEGHPVFASALCMLTAVLKDQRKYVDAHRVAKQHLAIQHRLPPDQQQLARPLLDVGDTLSRLGRSHEALTTLHDALTHALVRHDPTSLIVAEARALIGRAHLALGNAENAREWLQLADSEFQPTDDWERSRRAVILNHKARLPFELQDLDAASETLVDALAIQRRVLGDRHGDIATTLDNLARIESKKGNFADAIARIEEAISILEVSRQAGHPFLVHCRMHLASTLRCRGDRAGARAAYLAAAEAWRGHPPQDRSHLGLALLRVGSIDLEVGEFESARSLLAEACAVFDEHPPNARPALHWFAYAELGKALLALGDHEEATTALHAAAKLAASDNPKDAAYARAESVLRRLFAEAGIDASCALVPARDR